VAPLMLLVVAGWFELQNGGGVGEVGLATGQ
jgi:hypothetical protein